MINDNSQGKYAGVAIISTLAASLCCVVPIITIVAGGSSILSNFSWINAVRPYLIVLSMVVLALAWYFSLTRVNTLNLDCASCEPSKKISFVHSRSFLSIVTLFAIFMMTLPYYSALIYPKLELATGEMSGIGTSKQVIFKVQGMTCEACESHVDNELSKVDGVLSYKTSYNSSSSLVTFDSHKVDVRELKAAIRKTGYKVVN